MARKRKVAFVCTHNACRSQIAEALGKWYGKDVFDSYSAGTDIAAEIHPVAVEAMMDVYGIDMTLEQYPKTLDEIPQPDILISLGCGATGPEHEARFVEEWEIIDPTGKEKDAFLDTITILEDKVKYLVDLIIRGRYPMEEEVETENNLIITEEFEDEMEDAIEAEKLVQED